MDRRDFLKTAAIAGTSALLPKTARAFGSAQERSEMVVRAYTALGDVASEKAYRTLYLADLDYNPFPRDFDSLADGAHLTKIPAKPFMAAVHAPVENFGDVWLYADNEGRGYTAADREINLNLDIAKSRYRKVSEATKKAEDAGCVLSGNVTDRMEKAAAKLKEAESSVSDKAKMAQSCNDSLVESLWAGEFFVLERAKHAISKRGPRKDFLFGCNFFGHPGLGAKYDDQFAALFNFATVPFYWRSFEKEKGEPNWANTDEMVDWLISHNIKPKGHPLVWFNKAGVPTWIEGKPFEEIKKLSADRTTEIVTRYKGKIDIFDVINEAHDFANEPGFSPEQLDEMTRTACDASKAANPQVLRIVNSTAVWGSYAAREGSAARSPLQYLKDCIRAGVEFEAVGIQCYYPGQDMFEVDRMLERFAALGKRVHITELGVASDPGPDDRAIVKSPWGLWHKPWSEEVQADWIEQFYTICYSKDYMDAITWWDFSDNGHFWPHGGLLRPTLEPKESYTRLKGLISGWRRQDDGSHG